MPSLGRHSRATLCSLQVLCVCVCQLVELLECALDDSAVFSGHGLLSSLPHPPKIMSQLSNYFSDLYLHETRILQHVSCHF